MKPLSHPQSLRLFRLIGNIPVLGRGIERVRDTISHRKCLSRGQFAQHGEDQFLKDYFGDHVGTYLDIGANHPFRISNTYMLYRCGWSGVTVEPIQHHYRAHQRYRPRDTQIAAAIGPHGGHAVFYELVPSVLSTFDAETALEHIGSGAQLRRRAEVQLITLENLMREHFRQRAPDLLSVDAEGYDELILESNDWSEFRPRLVMFERVEESNDERVFRLLFDSGYRRLTRLGCNVVFESEGTTEH